MSTSTFYHWKARYKQPNQHAGQMPKCHWITDSERESIIAFYREYPEEGYRRLTFMMLDADVVAVVLQPRIECSKRPNYYKNGPFLPRVKAPDSISLTGRTNTGTSIWLMSTFEARSIICVLSLMVIAGRSCIGNYASR